MRHGHGGAQLRPTFATLNLYASHFPRRDENISFYLSGTPEFGESTVVGSPNPGQARCGMSVAFNFYLTSSIESCVSIAAATDQNFETETRPAAVLQFPRISALAAAELPHRKIAGRPGMSNAAMEIPEIAPVNSYS